MSKVKTIFEIEQERALRGNFGAGISVASGFDLGAKAPLDSRLTVKTIAERDAHVTGNRAYEGMLVYVEADNKTYQLINNAWEEFGFNEEKFQAGIKPLQDADKVLDGRIKTLEGLVVGGEGEGLEAVIEDVANNKADIADIKVNKADKSALNAEIARAKEAETALESKDAELQGAIDKEVSDRKVAITATEGKITAGVAEAKTYTDEAVSAINADITAVQGSVDALDARVKTNEDAIAEIPAQIATAKTEAVNTAKSYTDAEVAKAKTALEDSISAVEGRVDSLESDMGVAKTDISNLKDAVANKNNNTVVVETEDEIATANPEPKVGDMAYVIGSKRAYIFKGVDAPAQVFAVPAGWVVFDEITSEVDLVDYLKKSEAEATYRKLSAKIAEADLATELSGKINAKADKSYVDAELAKKTDEAYVDTKVEEVVAPVRTESAANKVAIAKEVTDRKGEITRVEGLVSGVSDSLTEKETALKAEDTKLNNRINKFAPVVGSEEPTDTEAGHVWLETL